LKPHNLLGIILCHTALQHPVSYAEDLDLATSLVDGTQVQVNLFEWKKKHLKMDERDAMFGDLGTRYWQNFCQWNEYVITALTASTTMCVVGIITVTCMGVYGRLHDMGISEKLGENVWRDEKHNIGETEAEAYCQEIEYSLK
jgi:hypothetical protein